MKLSTLTLGDLNILVNKGINIYGFINNNYTDDIKRDVAKFVFDKFVTNENNIQTIFEYTEEEIDKISSISIYDDINYVLLIDKIFTGMEFEPEELISLYKKDNIVKINQSDFSVDHELTDEDDDGDVVIYYAPEDINFYLNTANEVIDIMTSEGESEFEKYKYLIPNAVEFMLNYAEKVNNGTYVNPYSNVEEEDDDDYFDDEATQQVISDL